ncbi:MAG: HAD-IA family hydrolase [Rhodospirillaceae bacterium]
MTERARLALFDCDGTLVDSQHAIVSAMTAAWTDEGLAQPDPVKVRHVVGLSLVEAVARLLPEGEPAFHERLTDRYKRAFQRNRLASRFEEPLYPGMRELLFGLHERGVLLGVATGKSMRGLMAVLERHGLTGLFITLQTADFGPGKPDPAMLLRALNEAGADAADTVMIGDTVFDMEMACRGGVGAIGVGWGYHGVEELKRSGARRVVWTAQELEAEILA